MIDRNNYEAWFLDFAEGNLSEEKIVSLNEFLKKNPDLQAEFDELGVVFLDQDKFVFENKSSLKQKINVEKIEGLNDFEILAIKKLEGEITKDEEKELKSLIYFSGDLRKESEIFERTKLKPDKAITYRDKDKLKQKNLIPLWVKYVSSIAAIGLLILFVSKIADKDFDNSVEIVKNTVITEKSSIKTGKNTKIISGTDVEIAPKQNSKEAVVTGNSNIVLSVRNNKIANSGNSLPNKKNESNGIVDRSQFDMAMNDENNTGINNKAIVKISLNKPVGDRTVLQKYNLPSLTKINIIEKKHSIVDVDDYNRGLSILTPKQFIIKAVKEKLEIDDNNYDKVNTIELVSATLEKTKIGKLDFKKSKDNGKSYLAVNIGRFGIERSWNSN